MSDPVIDKLLSLRESNLLGHDAEADIAALVRLQRSGEYELRYSTNAIYPFLLSPESPGGLLLREFLIGYSGDMLSELWHKTYKTDTLPGWVKNLKNFLTEIVERTGRPLHSEELLGAIIVNNSHRYNELVNGERFSSPPSEITNFLSKRGLLPEKMCRQLFGLESREPVLTIPKRFALTIRITEPGLLKAGIVERWGQHPLIDDGSDLTAEYGLLMPEHVVFLPDELHEFDRLINAQPPLPEEAFQEFFEAHPKWLYLLGEQYESAIPQVKLPPVEAHEILAFVDGQIDEGDFFPDFLLKRIGLDLWDVLELKKAIPKIVVGRKGRRKFSEAVHEAVAQLQEYLDRLCNGKVRDFLRRKYGITVAKPIAMVLIGRDFEFKTLREKDSLKASEGVRVYTYDDLRRLAKHRTIMV